MILLAALSTVTMAHAQLVRSMGVKVGAVAANQRWSYAFGDLNTDTRWGFTGSAFMELLDIPVVSIILEAQYTQKGMSFRTPVTTAANPDATGDFITRRPRVDYLSIPLLAKARWETPVLDVYAMAGPRYDLLLTRHGDGVDIVIDQFRSAEAGATIGLGIETRQLLSVGLLAEVRYNLSFGDAFSADLLTVRNHTIDLMAGVRL